MSLKNCNVDIDDILEQTRTQNLIYSINEYEMTVNRLSKYMA